MREFGGSGGSILAGVDLWVAGRRGPGNRALNGVLPHFLGLALYLAISEM